MFNCFIFSEKKAPSTPKVFDQEHVSLPDLNNQNPDEFFYGGDANLWAHDLTPDNTPLYPNQLHDPEIQRMFDDYFHALEA